MKTISTELAINLMNLSEDTLNEINKVLNDNIYNNHPKDSYLAKYLKEQFNIDEFINYCKYELKLIPKTEKHPNNIYYKAIFTKHKKILTEIISNPNIFNYFYSLFTEKFTNKKQFKQIHQRVYLNFLNYLCCYYYKKDIILNNLNKMKELGIDKFKFDPAQMFFGIHTIIIQENKNMSSDKNKEYCIQGFCTDKEKKYISQPEEGVYEFIVSTPKYKIEYTKGSLSHDKITMEVNSLDFDTNSLPTYEELYDSKILPDIDFNHLKKKIDAVNFNYATIISLKSAKELVFYIEYLLKQLEINDLTEEKVYIKNQLIFLKSLINNLSKMKESQIEKYITNGIITNSELHNLTESKIKEEICRNKHLERKK